MNAGLQFVGGLLGGALLVGLSVLPLRPGPAEGPVPTASPDVETRTVTRTVGCPRGPLATTESEPLQKAVKVLRAHQVFLEGQLEVEIGADLPPPTANEAPEVVRAWLEQHVGEGELELDCSEHPCRGSAVYPMMAATPGGDKEAFRNAIFEKYPDSLALDSISSAMLEGGDPSEMKVTVNFVIAESLESEAQKTRLEHLNR